MGTTLLAAPLLGQIALLFLSAVCKIAVLLSKHEDNGTLLMKIIPLSEYLAGVGTQQTLADALRIQQSAVSQMVRAGRNIQVILHDDGRIEAQEIRPVPARPRRPAA